MPLTLHKATDTDLSPIISLQFAAFQQSSPIERLIYPLGLTPSILASSLASREKSFHEPEVCHLKVVDSDLGSESGQMQPAECDEEHSGGSSSEVTNSKGIIIAFARYYVWHEDREATTWDAPYSVREGELGPAEEVNLEAARLFFGKVREMRRKFVGVRKCVYLSLLATHPSHQRLGAGTMLVQWGIDLADQEELDFFLTSTPIGYSLYRKMGFEDITAFEIDLGTLGGTVKKATCGVYKHVLMRRGTGEGKRG